MNINVGTPDRIVRLVLGLFLVAAPFVTGWSLFAGAAWTWGSVAVGLVLAATAVLRFCPAYGVLGISTAKRRGR